MVKRRRSRPNRLPRLTLLAWCKQDLTAFLNAVNQLNFWVQDLERLVTRLDIEVENFCAGLRRRKKIREGVGVEEKPGV